MNQAQNLQGVGFQQAAQAHTAHWQTLGHGPRGPHSVYSEVASDNTYLMPSSPSKRQRTSSDSYKPVIKRTCGQRPACLVNASVTYCGNDTIFAFGGFDQFTDEGKTLQLKMERLAKNK